MRGWRLGPRRSARRRWRRRPTKRAAAITHGSVAGPLARGYPRDRKRDRGEDAPPPGAGRLDPLGRARHMAVSGTRNDPGPSEENPQMANKPALRVGLVGTSFAGQDPCFRLRRRLNAFSTSLRHRAPPSRTRSDALAAQASSAPSVSPVAATGAAGRLRGHRLVDITAPNALHRGDRARRHRPPASMSIAKPLAPLAAETAQMADAAGAAGVKPGRLQLSLQPDARPLPAK